MDDRSIRWIFLLPDGHPQDGGNIAQLKLAEGFESTDLVDRYYYKKPSKQDHAIQGCLKRYDNSCCFIIHWGPHVVDLLSTLEGRRCIYVAHSTGWNIKPPPYLPIICVSRNSQAYWAQVAPRNPIFLLPNTIDDCFYNPRIKRDIDVLVLKRKSSSYLLEKLLPKLEKRHRVHLVTDWVDDVSQLMKRTRLYIYDSSEYFIKRGVSEGFGLTPLEAMACGAEVISSLNDALSDYLEPGINSWQLRGNVECDLATVDKALESPLLDPTIDAAGNWRAEPWRLRWKQMRSHLLEDFALEK